MDNPAQSTALTALGYSGDLTVAQKWLDVAWRALRREPSLPGLEARIGVDVDVEDVIDVIVAATLRVLRNPDGNLEESGQVDDYRESWRKADATQDVYFTAAELRRIQPALPIPTAGSFKYS